jgi:membrane protease YdiL (CAAX protease family)
VCISSEQSKSTSVPSFFHLALAGEAGLLLLAWALARWLEVSPGKHLQVTTGSVIWGLLATIPLLLVLWWMLTSTATPIRNLVDLVTAQVGPLVARCTLLQLGSLAAVAGISEEVLFRGVIQPGLSPWLTQSGALVAGSLIFGVVHAASSVYALFATLMGLYLGALFLLQGSLIPPILAHGLYDLVALGAVATRYRNTQS